MIRSRLSACLLLAACGSEPYTLVGDLDETDARVAVVVSEDAVVAYVCGGDQTIASHTRWFADTLWSTEFEASSGGWTLAADVTDAAIVGQLTDPAEAAWSFELTDAGMLYDAEDSGCRDGAVAGPEGDAVDVQGVWCDEVGALAQVTPVNAVTLDQQTIAVQVQTASGLRSFEMSAVVP